MNKFEYKDLRKKNWSEIYLFFVCGSFFVIFECGIVPKKSLISDREMTRTLNSPKCNWEKCQLLMMRLWQRSCLQDDGWSWFDLQNPSIPKRVKGWVRIVRERSSIEDEEGGYMVQDEAELIRVNSTLWSLTFSVDDARSQASHHRFIHHHTNLQRNIQT